MLVPMKRGAGRVAIVALGALVLAGCSAGNAPTAPTAPTAATGITTRGIGTATMTPDTVTLVIGVQTRDQSANAALDANTAKATALINVLKSKGGRPGGLADQPAVGQPDVRLSDRADHRLRGD